MDISFIEMHGFYYEFHDFLSAMCANSSAAVDSPLHLPPFPPCGVVCLCRLIFINYFLLLTKLALPIKLNLQLSFKIIEAGANLKNASYVYTENLIYYRWLNKNIGIAGENVQ